eukprot:Gb_24219 [translate_table: standard]
MEGYAAVVCQPKITSLALESKECVCPNTAALDTSVTLAAAGPWGGSGDGSEINVGCLQINLNYNEEYISEIKGFYGNGILPGQCLTVNAIEFKVVNTKTGVESTIGPFGTAVGTAFTSSAGGKFVGFYGRAGSTVHQSPSTRLVFMLTTAQLSYAVIPSQSHRKSHLWAHPSNKTLMLYQYAPVANLPRVHIFRPTLLSASCRAACLLPPLSVLRPAPPPLRGGTGSK